MSRETLSHLPGEQAIGGPSSGHRHSGIRRQNYRTGSDEQPWLQINQRQEKKQQPRPSAQKRVKGPGLQIYLSSLFSPHVWVIALQPSKASEMTHTACAIQNMT